MRRSAALRRFSTRGVPMASVSQSSGDALSVRWSDGHRSEYHNVWLRTNCASNTNATQQQINSATSFGLRPSVAEALIAEDGGQLHVEWLGQSGKSHTSLYDGEWLRRYAHDDAGTAPPAAAARAPQLATMEYSAVVETDAGLQAWLHVLATEGICVVQGAPGEADAVGRLGERIAPLSHAFQYGETWDVRTTTEPTNVAYTSEALPLHMDLPYYESPPGIQLLHCLRFDESVAGGASTFADAHAVAEELRKHDPAAFETLCRVPATFHKRNLDRAVPTIMQRQRPHVQLSSRGAVEAVFWSPPFEGPLQVRFADVAPYYRAYAAFEALLHEAEHVRIRMREGEIVTFNQRRILHGRDGFVQEAGGTRHLRGAYVNIDDFVCRYNVLERAGI
jgi:alpha-ketoglutarate-dependent taurine dioxygenase